MMYILLFLTLFLLTVVLFLVVQNSKIKNEHQNNMKKLHKIITSLHAKQQQLKEKLFISAEYKLNYSKDMKALGEEVVELQKVFINIINNKNYK